MKYLNQWIPLIAILISLGGIVAVLAVSVDKTNRLDQKVAEECNKNEIYKDKLADVLTEIKVASAKETVAIENLEKELKLIRMERRK
jgi:hypothetical protein